MKSHSGYVTIIIIIIIIIVIIIDKLFTARISTRTLKRQKQVKNMTKTSQLGRLRWAIGCQNCSLHS